MKSKRRGTSNPTRAIMKYKLSHGAVCIWAFSLMALVGCSTDTPPGDQSEDEATNGSDVRGESEASNSEEPDTGGEAGGGSPGTDAGTSAPPEDGSGEDAGGSAAPDGTDATGGFRTQAVDCAGVTADATVVIRDRSFRPEETTLEPGGVVRFENRESDVHDVTSGVPEDGQTGSLFESDLLEQGDAFCVQFGDPGEYPYFCSLHPSDMRATVIVQEDGGGGGADDEPREVSCTTETAVTIDIRDREFIDGSPTIAAGESVKWLNLDDEEHTVTSGTGEDDPDRGALFDSGILENGDSYCVEFPEGIFRYFDEERGADEMFGRITAE